MVGADLRPMSPSDARRFTDPASCHPPRPSKLDAASASSDCEGSYAHLLLVFGINKLYARQDGVSPQPRSQPRFVSGQLNGLDPGRVDAICAAHDSRMEVGLVPLDEEGEESRGHALLYSSHPPGEAGSIGTGSAHGHDVEAQPSCYDIDIVGAHRPGNETMTRADTVSNQSPQRTGGRGDRVYDREELEVRSAMEGDDPVRSGPTLVGTTAERCQTIAVKERRPGRIEVGDSDHNVV